MRATTFLWTSSQSEVCTQSYGAPKSWESQIWEFWDFHLRVPGQNAIWMWASWRGTKYTIRGKVMASLKFGSWWFLWVWVCPWFVLAPKVHSLSINQLIIWFVQARVSNWCLSLFLFSIPELQHAPLPSKCYGPRNVPQLLALLLFSPSVHIWVYKGGWEHVRMTLQGMSISWTISLGGYCLFSWLHIL
jgi:hypothetical protein